MENQYKSRKADDKFSSMRSLHNILRKIAPENLFLINTIRNKENDISIDHRTILTEKNHQLHKNQT